MSESQIKKQKAQNVLKQFREVVAKNFAGVLKDVEAKDHVSDPGSLLGELVFATAAEFMHTDALKSDNDFQIIANAVVMAYIGKLFLAELSPEARESAQQSAQDLFDQMTYIQAGTN